MRLQDEIDNKLSVDINKDIDKTEINTLKTENKKIQLKIQDIIERLERLENAQGD